MLLQLAKCAAVATEQSLYFERHNNNITDNHTQWQTQQTNKCQGMDRRLPVGYRTNPTMKREGHDVVRILRAANGAANWPNGAAKGTADAPSPLVDEASPAIAGNYWLCGNT